MYIRSYQSQDQEAVLAIWLAASRQAHAFLGEELLQEQRQKVRDIYLPMAENWVAEQDGQLLGFIGLLGQFIGGLFVDPGEHGTGTGRALVEHAAERLGELEVSVYALNQGALTFYQRCGFVETGRRPTDAEGLPFELVGLKRSVKTSS